MTGVYLLLWLADIASNISMVGLICTFGLVAMAVICGIAAVAGEFSRGEITAAWRQARAWVWMLAIPVLIACFTPSAKTIQVMVAAQAAQLAMATPLGDKALQAIDAVLDDLIASKKARK